MELDEYGRITGFHVEKDLTPIEKDGFNCINIGCKDLE